MTEARTEWTKAFLAAQRELPDIQKTKTAKIDTKGGGSYSYKYADLPDVLSAVRPILNRHGLTVTQAVAGERGSVSVTTRIYHEAGHVEEFGPIELGGGSDARTAGSAITYARRYSLTAALGIATDDDDDGAVASRPAPRVESPAEVEAKLVNGLKNKALEVCGGDKAAAKALFDRVVGPQSVTRENVGELTEALASGPG